ncbi:hypothetical protein QR680_004486 [Steinernema hermaphroditum]|uniref:C-type lectin domain-containing protein n=1 Tax=Steinernema hermaphroditum TaxID=289476 RepID=A0AA39HPZ3_9BILA|nr:hypothetical protein QR680_004486 [Steinernema hermaphroditum]
MSFLHSTVILLIVGFGVAQRVCPPNAVTSSDRTKCFHVVPVLNSFDDAERTCLNMQARFASVCNSVDNERISETAFDLFINLRMRNTKLWLGGTKQGSGNWTWLDDSVFAYSSWGSPSDYGNCVALDSATGFWSAAACDAVAAYVCEVDAISHSPSTCPTPTPPVCPPCPSCRSSTWTCPPVTECPPCPTQSPTTTRTSTVSTTRNIPESTSEASTLAATTGIGSSSPTSLAPSPTPGPAWKRYGGNVYCFNAARKNWTDAKQWCHSSGADLVSIHSAGENDFVFSLSRGSCWIGAQSPYQNASFAWSDGSEWSYTEWIAGEPNNPGGVFSCAQYFGIGKQWYSNQCGSKYPFVCKKKAN